METMKGDQQRVLEAAIAPSGGDAAKAARWYSHEQLTALDRKTPAYLVAEGRAADLLRYMASLESGPAG